jgi:hypothetical protein
MPRDRYSDPWYEGTEPQDGEEFVVYAESHSDPVVAAIDAEIARELAEELADEVLSCLE